MTAGRKSPIVGTDRGDYSHPPTLRYLGHTKAPFAHFSAVRPEHQLDVLVSVIDIVHRDIQSGSNEFIRAVRGMLPAQTSTVNTFPLARKYFKPPF